MRILLDECLPKDLARLLPGHEVKTVPQAGWASISNGRLLRLIKESGQFDLFITVDRRLPEENPPVNMPFAVILLRARSNRVRDIFPFAPEILRRLPEFQPGRLHVLEPPNPPLKPSHK